MTDVIQTIEVAKLVIYVLTAITGALGVLVAFFVRDGYTQMKTGIASIGRIEKDVSKLMVAVFGEPDPDDSAHLECEHEPKNHLFRRKKRRN